jgi:hypothetical protein
MSSSETKTSPKLSPEQRRDEVGYGWARYLKLDLLSNVKHISKDTEGKWHQDSYSDGATGDGASLFVLVKDTAGTHAVKVGAGEFSPRTFMQDGTYYGMDEMPYATRLKKLTKVTPVYTLEQKDGYFNLSPALNPVAAQEFADNPATYISQHARIVARKEGVDFNGNHEWYNREWRNGAPTYANAHNGGMVVLSPEAMQPIDIADLEAALVQARNSDVAAVAIHASA